MRARDANKMQAMNPVNKEDDDALTMAVVVFWYIKLT